MSIDNYFGSVIHSRTREDALADGDLVDVSHMAREARFRIPVALTRAVWAEVVEWDSDRPEPQDESGRLWDVLYMAGIAAGKAPGGDRVNFRVYRVPNQDRGRHWNDPELIELALRIGPGDEAEPVVTIMLPCED